jgi:hypothetical protein
MIERKKRVITDKITDVEHSITTVQYGVLNQRVKRASKAVIIPTHVKVPKLVKITPLNATAAKVFKDSFYTNLTLVYASNSTVSTALTKPTNSASYSCAADQLLLFNRDLYIAKTTVPASTYAAAYRPATDAPYWKRLEDFPTNAKAFLVIQTQASTATWADCKFAFEVEGN